MLLEYKNKYINNYHYTKKYKKPPKSKYKNILGLGVTFLLYFIKTLITLKTYLSSFFVFFVYRPGRKLSKFIFYKVFVKIYFVYLRIAKRLGFEGVKKRFAFTLNQKLVHFLVIIMTALLLFINLNTQTKASTNNFADQAHHTILAELVTSELGGFVADEKLITEDINVGATVASAQQSYLDNLSSVRSRAAVSVKDTTSEEESMVGQNGSMVHPNIVSTKITKQDRTKTVAYTVLPGDTISVIAEKFGVSVSTILWENNLSSYSIIRPGDVLNILPKTGITHKVARNETVSSIAKKYKVDIETILRENKLNKNSSLKIGKKLFIPGGRKIAYRAPAPKTYTGFTAIKNIVSPPPSKAVSGNKMAWPTSATRITQYYSWRHHGLDIAKRGKIPIYAADSGVIEYTGYMDRGYGNNILINHGGGKKTRYAHLSKFYVKKGDHVTKGQTIGLMGSTGWSTGQHLHFEVIINGKKYNPLNYIR